MAVGRILTRVMHCMAVALALRVVLLLDFLCLVVLAVR
jgi:hypothetical protein